MYCIKSLISSPSPLCLDVCHFVTVVIITATTESQHETDNDKYMGSSMPRHTPLKPAWNQQIYGSGTVTYGSIAWQPPPCDVAFSKEPTVDSSDCCINVINKRVLRIKN